MMAKTNKDSFDRLSEAKERQSYQMLNEPGTSTLSFQTQFGAQIFVVASEVQQGPGAVS